MLRHHHGVTKFEGCQCFKDCSCADRFVPEEYNFYSVMRRIKPGKYKQTRYKELLAAGRYYDSIK